MRIGRVVLGLVVVLAVVAVAIVVATRADDPAGPTEPPSGDVEATSRCPSEEPGPEKAVWGIAVDKSQHTNSVGATGRGSPGASTHPLSRM